MKVFWIVCIAIMRMIKLSSTQDGCPSLQVLKPNNIPGMKVCISGDCDNTELKTLLSVSDGRSFTKANRKNKEVIVISGVKMDFIKFTAREVFSIKLAGLHFKPTSKNSKSMIVYHKFSSTVDQIRIILRVRRNKVMTFTDFFVGRCVQVEGLLHLSFVDPYDVFITGAGPSGCYSAWQIAQNYPDLSIALVDAQYRIGGRPTSHPIPDITDFTAELGPMRIKESMTKLQNIVKDDLGLTLFKFTTPSNKDTLFHLRDQTLAWDDIEVGNVPFQLTDEEKKYSQSTSKLREYWNAKLLVRPVPPNPWYRKCNNRADNVFAYEKGTMNAYLTVTKKDAIEYIAYRSLFPGTNYFGNENYAIYTMPEVLASGEHNVESAEYRDNTNKETSNGEQQLYGIREGFEKIPERMNTLFHYYTKNQKSNTFVNTTVLKIHRQENGMYAILYERNGQTAWTAAKQVILTTTAESMKLIQYTDEKLSSFINEKLKSVRRIPAVKTFMAYDSPWWHQQGNGKAFDYLRNNNLTLKQIGTDLPVGTILDYGQDRKTKKSVLLAYSEWWNNLWFWEPTIDPKNEFETTDIHMKFVNKQLSQIFNISESELPRPYFTTTKAWFKGPIWLAWTQTAPGFNYSAIRLAIRNPQTNLYVAGGTFGKCHGWVECALNNTQEVLDMIKF